MPINVEIESDSKCEINLTVKGFRFFRNKELCFVGKSGVKIMTLER